MVAFPWCLHAMAPQRTFNSQIKHLSVVPDMLHGTATAPTLLGGVELALLLWTHPSFPPAPNLEN